MYIHTLDTYICIYTDRWLEVSNFNIVHAGSIFPVAACKSIAIKYLTESKATSHPAYFGLSSLNICL